MFCVLFFVVVSCFSKMGFVWKFGHVSCLELSRSFDFSHAQPKILWTYIFFIKKSGIPHDFNYLGMHTTCSLQCDRARIVLLKKKTTSPPVTPKFYGKKTAVHLGGFSDQGQLELRRLN